MSLKRLKNQLIPPVINQMLDAVKSTMKIKYLQKNIIAQSKIHLACGTNVLNEWVNIDRYGNGKVIGWDLRKGLPFISSNDVKFIYCEHFIEHISYQDCIFLLKECYRVLSVDGVIRLSTPNVKKIIEEYQKERLTEWNDVNWNPETPCQMINEAFHLWGHLFLYDEKFLRKTLKYLGFKQVSNVKWRESNTPELRNLECRPFHEEIILEAKK